MVWNVQGAGSKARKRVFRNFCLKYRLDIVGIVEPRISGRKADDFVKASGFDFSHRVEANGFSGGIWILWKSVVKVEVLINNKHFIHVRVGEGVDSFLLTIIYASPNAALRKFVWEDLSLIAAGIREPWILGGDFNAAMKEGEKRGGAVGCTGLCNLFKSWVEDNHLEDLGFIGPKFTWRRAWVGHPKFLNLVENNWKSQEPLVNCINRFTEEVRHWNHHEFGNIFKRKNNLLSRINGIQRTREVFFSQKLADLEQKLKVELNETLLQEELLWIQKSRSEWILDGDRNTKFYHQKVKQRRRRNKIVALKDEEGNIITDQEALKELALNFFSNLFTGAGDLESLPPSEFSFPVIEASILSKISAVVTEEEIKLSLWDMNPWKAPGIDGLHASFYQSHWSIVGQKLVSFIKDIFSGSPIPPEANKTLITLIPKNDYPESLKQYRPISLCNVSFKIITKLIARRLQQIMPVIIGPEQTSFVAGRHITDNIILAQEAMHSMRKKTGKRGYMAIKIDLEKAYDKISWHFLQETLVLAGVPENITKVIMQCVTTTTLSIMWNGAPLPAFHPSCGLRQGDPLSPYLFVLCIERLAHMINSAVTNGSWRPLRLGRNNPPLSHLFFADDLMLFCEASLDQGRVVNQILQTFCKASGQRVNNEKTKVLFSSNISNNMGNMIANNLGFSKTSDLGKYLGMDLIHGRVLNKHSKGLMDRINSRLASWKTRVLSMAGRSTLIKSVVSSIPIYSMQTMAIPMGHCNQIEADSRKFLWGSSDGNRKLNLVKWDYVCQPRSNGGLGFKKMKSMNVALLMKLGWSLITNQDKLWVKVVAGKYRFDFENPSLPRLKGSSHLWQNLYKIWSDVRQGVRWAVCDGKKARFWLDPWLGENVVLSQVAIDQIPPEEINGTVSYYSDINGNWSWNKFTHLLPFDYLSKIANSCPPNEENGQDFIYWGLSPSGNLSTKSAYNLIESRNWEATNTCWKVTWEWTGPERIKQFIWLVMHGKLLTNAELNRRHISDSAVCSRCGVEVEDCDHVLRKCWVTKLLWSRFVKPADRALFFNVPFQEWLVDNLSGSYKLNYDGDWPQTFGVIIWKAWHWRNLVVIAKEDAPLSQIFYEIQTQLRYMQASQSCVLLAKKATKEKTTVSIGWSCPPMNWVKINTDGAFDQRTGIAKAGGLVRNAMGNWLGSFSMTIGYDSVLGAEFKGAYHGLLLAWNLGCRRVILEVDNKMVVEKVNSNEMAGHHSNLLCAVRALIARNWEVKVQHVYREANNAADHLASKGHGDLSGLVVHESIPSSLVSWILHDMHGTAYDRNICV
ncbi:uncharacterized protein LOC126672232 [Mercurialis annua]|uniref:uncharacterized protein LOC126672232 n=1 Tax=Mercurialis annua TaxID=3986 RepID=UPI00215FF986|nr:uncharacterized protein LOC126672232 [Mercurialis annua]